MRSVAVAAALLVWACTTWLLVLQKLEARRLRQRLSELTRSSERARDQAHQAQALLASLRRTLESMPQGVVVADRAGRVLFRNPAASALVGKGLDEAVTSQALSELLRSARAGQSTSKTLELYGPPRRTITASGLPMGEDGTAAVVFEDLSERKHLDAVRRDFVANVSHELKTPVGALGLLAETLGSEDDLEVVRRLAVRVQAESSRAARIINDLLSLSRLEAEERPHHEPVPVEGVITEAVERVRPAASVRGVSIQVPEVPPDWRVTGDSRQLVSAVSNLLDNAVKYSGKGSAVELGVAAGDGTIDLTVSDHGIGIPSRDLDRVFERFYRVDRGRGRDTGGTGLGLAIVRHVAENHGGQVLVRSQEGEGSVFTLRLPAPLDTAGSRPREVVPEAG